MPRAWQPRDRLVDGLIGQAKVIRQLDRREDFLRCLLEVLTLARLETGPGRNQVEESEADIILESPRGCFPAIQLEVPYAERIQDSSAKGLRIVRLDHPLPRTRLAAARSGIIRLGLGGLSCSPP